MTIRRPALPIVDPRYDTMGTEGIYTEFPVDLIVDIHWKRTTDGGPPGGGTYPCGGGSYLFSGQFPVNRAGDWFSFGTVHGDEGPITPDGTPLMAEVSVGGGNKYAPSPYYSGMSGPHPAYIHHGCGFDIGDGSGAVASTDTDIAEGDTGALPSTTATIAPAPGESATVMVRAHGGVLDWFAAWWLAIGAAAGFQDVSIVVSLICKGTAPLVGHMHELIPADQMPDGVRLVSRWQ